MADLLFKIRITSPNPEAAELLRTALKQAFGDKLTLNKARKGSNPKYAHLAQVLAYGELEFSQAELEAAAAPQLAYTQETINLTRPAKRRRKSS